MGREGLRQVSVRFRVKHSRCLVDLVRLRHLVQRMLGSGQNRLRQ